MARTNDGTTNDNLVDLVTTLPVVISDTEAVYLYGLDIIARNKATLGDPAVEHLTEKFQL